MGSDAFLRMPGVSGLRPYACTHLKKALCRSRSFGRACDKYRRWRTLAMDEAAFPIEKSMNPTILPLAMSE